MFCDDNAQERGNIFTVGSFFVLFSTICLRSSITPRVVATSDEHLSRCGTHIHTSYLSTSHQRKYYCLTLIMLGIFVVKFNCLLFYRCKLHPSNFFTLCSMNLVKTFKTNMRYAVCWHPHMHTSMTINQEERPDVFRVTPFNLLSSTGINIAPPRSFLM